MAGKKLTHGLKECNMWLTWYYSAAGNKIKFHWKQIKCGWTESKPQLQRDHNPIEKNQNTAKKSLKHGRREIKTQLRRYINTADRGSKHSWKGI